MYKDIRERYKTDPNFRYLVDTMTKAIIDCQFTPSEMREAALLASINYEMIHVDTLTIPKEFFNDLKNIKAELSKLKDKL